MPRFIYYTLILLIAHSLRSFAQTPPPHVGDIPFDSRLDDSSFHLCDTAIVFQYYNTGSYFLKNKDSLGRYFLSQFIFVPEAARESGYITVKFVINCKGLTGRFRVYGMDSGYQAARFNERLSGELLSLVKHWKFWEPASYGGKIFDSYQYITFRIRNGNIISISP